MRIALFACLILVLSTCGRPLTETERAFSRSIHGETINLNRVRFVDGLPVQEVTFKRKARPRVSCREKILPPITDKIITTKPAAVSLFNKVLFSEDWYLDDYAPAYPDKLHLVAAMLFAHEMTHIWQWQNRKVTGYHPLRAAVEHGTSDDPYLFDLEGDAEFLSHGFEQQGAIVEEYVCCRAIAPQAARTKRLHTMLKGAFPVSDLPASGREHDVYMPWKDAELDGICD
jgi:hypothetical protein